MSEKNRECEEKYEYEREYKREGMNQYIVMEQKVENQLEVIMLRQNQPPNLLPIEIRNQDGHMYFYYNITNRRSLEKITEKTALSYAEIKKLFDSIVETIEMMREYLLDADRLLLEEDMIYKAEQYRFVYFPGRESNIVEQIQNLVTYLMDKIDHKDQEAVVYIYGLYRVIREGNFDIPYLKTLEHKREENPYKKIVEEHRMEKNKMEEVLYQKREEEERKKEQEMQKTEKIKREESQKRENIIFFNPVFRWGICVFFGFLLAYEGYYIYGKTDSIEIQILCILTFFAFIVYLIFLFLWTKTKKEEKKIKNILEKLERSSSTDSSAGRKIVVGEKK